MRKISWQIIVILVLSLLVIGLVIYVGLDKYYEKKQSEMFSAYQLGAQKGYERAVLDLIEKSNGCNIVPVFYENKSVKFIDVDCLKETNQ